MQLCWSLCFSPGITCPVIDTLENGQVFGNTYHVGDTVTFQCNSDNFFMYGPVNRTCLENWRWTGTTTTCDDDSKLALFLQLDYIYHIIFNNVMCYMNKHWRGMNDLNTKQGVVKEMLGYCFCFWKNNSSFSSQKKKKPKKTKRLGLPGSWCSPWCDQDRSTLQPGWYGILRLQRRVYPTWSQREAVSKQRMVVRPGTYVWLWVLAIFTAGRNLFLLTGNQHCHISVFLTWQGNTDFPIWTSTSVSNFAKWTRL